MVKQVLVSNETRTHSMQHSSVLLSRSVLLRCQGSSFSPEAGPFLSAKGVCSQLKKCARKWEFHHAKVGLM